MKLTERQQRVKQEILNNKYFSIARQQMFLSDHQIRVGAVMVIGSKQYFATHNQRFKSHPLLERHYPIFAKSMHAELDALIKYNEVRFGRLPKKSVMYVYREDKHGVVKAARPCTTCEKLIREAGIKRVFYSTENGIKMEVL